MARTEARSPSGTSSGQYAALAALAALLSSLVGVLAFSALSKLGQSHLDSNRGQIAAIGISLTVVCVCLLAGVAILAKQALRNRSQPR